MTGRPIGKQTITRIRATTTTDRHGNAVRDWGTAAELMIRRCAVEPGAPQEYLLGRDADRIAFFVMAPLSADVVSSDRIRYAGRVYEVSGEPAPWPSDSGRLDYLAIVLQKWEG